LVYNYLDSSFSTTQHLAGHRLAISLALIASRSAKSLAVIRQMKKLIESFATKVGNGEIEIYNEFSLQHELGIFIRNALNDMKIQFERNVSYFRLANINFVKKEIDISVFEIKDNTIFLEAAIELKYPRNGQYPEQMFSFCKDIQFAEQLKQAGFRNTFVVIFADDHLFYEGNSDGIYGYFRGKRILTGKIKKPTGTKSQEVNITGS